MAGHASSELVAPVAGEDEMGVAVDEAGQHRPAIDGHPSVGGGAAPVPTASIRSSTTITHASCSSPVDAEAESLVVRDQATDAVDHERATGRRAAAPSTPSRPLTPTRPGSNGRARRRRRCARGRRRERPRGRRRRRGARRRPRRRTRLRRRPSADRRRARRTESSEIVVRSASSARRDAAGVRPAEAPMAGGRRHRQQLARLMRSPHA